MEDLKFLQILKKESFTDSNETNVFIAKFILQNLKEIPNYNLDNFAKVTNSSKPSVIRFCNKIGISGFSELKFQCQNLNENNLNFNIEFNFKKDFINNKNIYKEYLQIKNNSSEIVLSNYMSKKNLINDFLKKLENAKTIYMLGMNLAYNTSRNFAQRIRWLNKNIIHERDLNSIESYINKIDENDILIITSLSGNSKYLIDFVKKLFKKTYIFGILGENGEINKLCNLVIEIPQIEYKIWDSYSIRGQCLIQILDYIYIDFTNYLLCKSTK